MRESQIGGTLVDWEKANVLNSEQTEQAIRQVLAVDSDAFRILVRKHRLILCSYLGSQKHRVDDVDDLAQEVCMTAFRDLARFKLEGNYGAWNP